VRRGDRSGALRMQPVRRHSRADDQAPLRGQVSMVATGNARITPHPGPVQHEFCAAPRIIRPDALGAARCWLLALRPCRSALALARASAAPPAIHAESRLPWLYSRRKQTLGSARARAAYPAADATGGHLRGFDNPLHFLKQEIMDLLTPVRQAGRLMGPQ
jgi:hypothetical protein